MTFIKTPEEITILRESGRRLAAALNAVADAVVPGATPRELGGIAQREIEGKGDSPAFLNYCPPAAAKPFPAALCVSVNNNVVHGIPGDYAFREGDIVGLDLGVKHRGMITDMARTVPVGTVDEKAKALLAVTGEALMRGIAAARAGNRVGDIGYAVESYVTAQGFSVVHELGGHGVGHKVHEEPHIPNWGNKGEGLELKEGMVLAIEPIVNEGSREVGLSDDGYTIRTKDGSRSAHFEHTILVTKEGGEILTDL